MYRVSLTFIAECENQLKIFFLVKNIIVILRQFYKGVTRASFKFESDTINISSSIFRNYVALIIVNRFLSSSVWFHYVKGSKGRIYILVLAKSELVRPNTMNIHEDSYQSCCYSWIMFDYVQNLYNV